MANRRVWDPAFTRTLFETSCSGEFLESVRANPSWDPKATYASEPALFEKLALPFIHPVRREQKGAIEHGALEPSDVKGVIHSHSTWSDGSNTLEEMAKACIAKGYEYLVISDHSKSAFYANGLSEERIREQHLYVDELNAKLAPDRKSVV